jgi:hypothetical protein
LAAEYKIVKVNPSATFKPGEAGTGESPPVPSNKNDVVFAMIEGALAPPAVRVPVTAPGAFDVQCRPSLVMSRTNSAVQDVTVSIPPKDVVMHDTLPGCIAAVTATLSPTLKVLPVVLVTVPLKQYCC